MTQWQDEASQWLSDRTGVVTSKLLELLADGEWHVKDEIVVATMPVIPAARAIRSAKNKRYSMAKRTARRSLTPEEFQRWLEKYPSGDEYVSTRADAADENRTIQVGARQLVLDVLNKSKRIETRVEDGVAQVRRIQLSAHAQFRMGMKGGEAATEAE